VRISFHTDPLNLPTVCADLEEHGAVCIETTRPHFRDIAARVEAAGVGALALAVQGPDGDFHHVLLRSEEDAYEGRRTDQRLIKAIVEWQKAGHPIPHTEPA
jgi:hypothetical protein